MRYSHSYVRFSRRRFRFRILPTFERRAIEGMKKGGWIGFETRYGIHERAVMVYAQSHDPAIDQGYSSRMKGD